MQTQTTQNTVTSTTRWKIRDFITVAIFNVIMIIIFTVGLMITSVVLTPSGSYLAGAGIMALFNGPIYMVMSNKIAKRGVLFFTSLLTGLYFLAFGQTYFLPTLIVGGIVCELVMWGKDTYLNPVRNAIGYSVFYISYSLCGTVPLVFFREQYLTNLAKSFSQEQLSALTYYYGTPGMALIMCAISTVGALIGCWIGSLLLKKHIKKAKLV